MTTSLAPASLLAAASRHGIFTSPTMAHCRGLVLLGSLGLDLQDAALLDRLHDMHAAGEIRLEACDRYCVARSLVERGLSQRLIEASAVPLWAATVHAVGATAAATTANTLLDTLGVIGALGMPSSAEATIAHLTATVNAHRGVILETAVERA